MTPAAPAQPLAESIREAFVEAALAAYEDARVRGLCHEGAWEIAVGALRQVDVAALLERESAPEPRGPS